MKLSLYLGTYKNVKVFIHWTFSLLLLWIMISNVLTWATTADILWTIAFVLGLFFWVILHEFGHSLAALGPNHITVFHLSFAVNKSTCTIIPRLKKL